MADFFNSNFNIAKSGAGLVIKTSSSAVAKTVNAVQTFIDGTLTAVAAGDVSLTNYTYVTNKGVTATAALTIADGYTVPLTVYSNGSAFAVGKGSVVANTSSIKSTDFDRSLMAEGYALIGYIVVKNATGSTFTGGTTALDTSNLTVTYIDAFSASGM